MQALILLVLLFGASASHAAKSVGIQLHHTLPKRVKMQTGDLTATPIGAGPTPSLPGRRRLIEQDSSTTFHRRGRQLLQSNFFELDGLTFQFYEDFPDGSPFQLPPEFAKLLKLSLFNSTASVGRRLLDDAPSLTFYSTWKMSLNGVANGIFVFNQEAIPFLDILTASGYTYTFARGVLLLPDDQSDSVSPSYAVSPTGFRPLSPSEPTITRLSTKNATATVPDVSIRFDYTTPLNGGYSFSLYFTTLGATSPPQGLGLANLAISPLAPSVEGAIERAQALAEHSG